MSRASETAWSRRRAAVQAEAEAETLAVQQETAEAARDELARKSDEDILHELNLKDPDQMRRGDDFAAFMRAEVPQRLRRRALRTLWRSNPVLACVDELVDYGDDFKAQWNSAGVISTAYRVGKGMLAHVEEMERQEAAAQEDAAQEDAETGATDAPGQDDAGPVAADEAALAPEPVSVNEPGSVTGPVTEPGQGDEAQPVEPRPRMRFEFEEVS